MSLGKESHARERLVHHSASRCCHDHSGRSGAAAVRRRSGPAATTDRHGRPGPEDIIRTPHRSAACRCCWPRSSPARPAELAGSPGPAGPGRPARPAGAECCGTPGRGSDRPARRRLRLPSALRHVVLLLLLSSVFRIAESCSSRANPKPRDPSLSTRRPYTFKTQPCPAMYQEHFCLNGATCFKVNIGHNPLYNCECASGFMGQRCEFKDPDGSYSHLRRPGRPAARRSLQARPSLTSADLTSGDLISADLTSADLTSANLTSADLVLVSAAPLTSATPRPAGVTLVTAVTSPGRRPDPGDLSSPPPPSPPCARGSASRDAILEQASIAGGAGVALLVCLLLSGLLYVWSKRRRKNAASAGQLTPRFSMRQSSSHVVQMEPAPTNPQPAGADVIELQPADRWAPPPPPATTNEQAAPAAPSDATSSADPQSRPCDRPP